MATREATYKSTVCIGCHDPARVAGNDRMGVGEMIQTLEAEAKAGVLLKDMELDRGGRPSENRSSDRTSLSDLGVSKNQSSNWQLTAGRVEG